MVWLAAARSSVWPSGSAFATEALPMVPPAPVRFSTITLRPSSVPSSALKARARMSCTPPAANGTTMRMKPCCAEAAVAASANSSAAMIFITSDPAPLANHLLVDRHRLADALHAAVLVGLVRELRLARAEHHRRRALVDLQQIARVGVVGRGARLRLRAEIALANLEHALYPFLFRRRPHRRHVREHVELHLLPQQLS